MAKNFYEEGLDFLLNKVIGVFDPAERAMLEWLHHAAKDSEELYWQQIATIAPGSPFDLQIESVKMKCRLMNLQAVFHHMDKKYNKGLR